MGKGEQLWRRLAEQADLSEESLPGQSIVEVAGTGRVLIENHLGVKAYSRECIVVCMKYGYVHVRGTALELSRMTKEQLIIFGKIEQVVLQRRC